jgi:hypothetical protein
MVADYVKFYFKRNRLTKNLYYNPIFLERLYIPVLIWIIPNTIRSINVFYKLLITTKN